ncbi:hypothetical protein PFLUV_G00000030 [Perca fluviatilis]|uniref:Uncharacterized protein n=1 Tax=Perca fluviatilis TaxID=8168 RepID=A0A6A5FQ15_PERFL|nr:hypothetical protein PFLUV_G00000030 [Perca fluviatilis]
MLTLLASNVFPYLTFPYLCVWVSPETLRAVKSAVVVVTLDEPEQDMMRCLGPHLHSPTPSADITSCDDVETLDPERGASQDALSR